MFLSDKWHHGMMELSDPYRGNNPMSIARYLRYACTRCPICREKCDFEIVFDRDDETVHVTSICEKCGKTSLIPSISEEGDVEIVFEGLATEYEPDQNGYELKRSLDGRPVEGADRNTLRTYSEYAKVLATTKRPSRSVLIGKAVASEYRSRTGQEGWEDAYDLCLGQVTATATVLTDTGKNDEASELFNEYLALSKEHKSGRSFAFILAWAYCLFAEGDAKTPTAPVRETISDQEKMRSENRLPADDPFILSRAYEALGVLLSAKNDKKGSAKALKKALDDSRSILEKNVTEEGLEWRNRCAREYAVACYWTDMRKRGTEALKESVKFCSNYKDRFPLAYADAILEKAMSHVTTDQDFPPHMREDMTEVIGILERTGLGRYTHLPNAYYYRALTGPDKDKLDLDDLKSAYDILLEGVISGKVPDSVAISVMDTYVGYLEKEDDPRSDDVRRELAGIGIWVHPPIRKKQEKKSEQ